MTLTKMTVATLALMASVSLAGWAPASVAAQEPAPKAQDSARTLTPLKVTVVISRYLGEVRKSNLPYTLSVNANDRRGTSIRMGSMVPIPTTRIGGSGEVSYNYQNVGVNIDCTAEMLADGRIRLELTVNDSGVADEAAAGAPGARQTPPSIVNFTSTSLLLLRDGQTIQYTTAADKVTGEVVKVDVTANIVK